MKNGLLILTIIFVGLIGYNPITQAQDEGPVVTTTSVCYNGYENPEWWRNDYYRRLCGSCEVVFGHDFELEGVCELNPL